MIVLGVSTQVALTLGGKHHIISGWHVWCVAEYLQLLAAETACAKLSEVLRLGLLVHRLDDLTRVLQSLTFGL